MSKKSTELLVLALKTLNRIDDYFEYRNESIKDRKYVQSVLNDYTKAIEKINNAE